MSEMEDKLNSVLSNPQMMQQIMAMAQSLGQSSGPQTESELSPNIPQIDPAMIQKLSGIAGHNSIDANQQALLKALHPYLSKKRVGKLERAMRAAKMARMASGFLNQGGLSLLTGR